MTNKTTDCSQNGDGGKPQQQQVQDQTQPQPQPQTGLPAAAPGPPQELKSCSNKVYKSGYLFLSSRGIGWTSWKKRWFMLTRTSLVFFRSDPNAIPQKGGEVNLTLGGIDLNSSGSVVVKADKKLLTVLFPDGRDGRAFTLKAETLEDLNEWKAALEEALSNAPSAATVTGQNGVIKNDQSDAVDVSADQPKDKKPVKSLVIGRPILLALEDMDGTPSFLEKALRFIEEHGVKVEGILRQAADVDDVECRIRDYGHGKTDFPPEDDAHVIADCVKYVLRELPSSPVPASCCNALLEACRTDRSTRVNAMRNAICETFPEPNRRLLQRILMMMQTVASHKAENRMSISAVAACMAPLLLRPLLAGDCELEHGFDMEGDGSVQLLQAAAAANHAQAIVITLLEEYDNLFGEGSVSPELYTDSEDSGTETEEVTDDDEDYDDNEYDSFTESSHEDEESENSSSGNHSGSGHIEENDLHDDKSGSKPSEKVDFESPQASVAVHDKMRSNMFPSQRTECSSVVANKSGGLSADNPAKESLMHESTNSKSSSSTQKSVTLLNGPVHSVRRPANLGRTAARKNLSMESIDFPSDDETEVQRLENTKIDLQNKIDEEAKVNAVLQENLEKRKNALHDRRLALEQDVARLQEQLLNENKLRSVLESGLNLCQWPLPVSANIDDNVKENIEEIAQAEADVKNLKQKVDDLGVQLSQQRELNHGCLKESSNQSQQTKLKDRQKGFEATSASRAFEMSRRSKSAHVDQAQIDVGVKLEAPPLPIKLPHRQADLARNSMSSAVNASSSSKKSGARSEGVNSTTSALSKLTNRLNFLKERRSQIANELQTIDKGRNSNQLVLNNSQQSMGSEDLSSETSNDLDKGVAAEGLSAQNIKVEKGRSEDHFAHLERGFSESNHSVEKGPSMRTFSR